MRKIHERRGLNRTSVLKIDKDCVVDPELNMEYIRTILRACRRYELEVLWVKSSRSRHGMHFYIKIKPAVKAQVANNLQYLLGDDAKRVAFNSARIERANGRLTTVYRNYCVHGAASGVEIQSFRFAL
jgi:hypothetical protein